MRAGSRAAKSVLETEEIDPLDISASSAFWKTPAQDLDEPARSGWLEKEGHVVQNWKRRWFVLWPASGSKWAAKHNETKWAESHGRDRTQQLLLYYESETALAPKGIIPLQPDKFVTENEAGNEYRGEEVVVLTVAVEAAAHQRYVIRSDEPGNPRDLPHWVDLVRQGTGAELEPSDLPTVKLGEDRYYRVDCPQRRKDPAVTDVVAWRKSPHLDDKLSEEEDSALGAGAEHGSVWKAVVESSDWVQAENGRWLPKRYLRQTESDSWAATDMPASRLDAAAGGMDGDEPTPASERGSLPAVGKTGAEPPGKKDRSSVHSPGARLEQSHGIRSGPAPRVAADEQRRPSTPPSIGSPAPAPSSGRSSSRRSGEQTMGDFRPLDHLGDGAYARVIKAVRKKDEEVVAIKIVNKSHVTKHDKVKYVKTERDILKLLHHSPWVTCLHSTFQSRLELYYVMELCPNGELATQLDRYASQPEGLPLASAKCWGAELVSALADLFAEGVIHRDLKPENILLDADRHLKLCDFGTAKLVGNASPAGGQSTRAFSFVGSADYVSPELLADEPSAATAASDLWALGCVLFQMLSPSAAPPFKNVEEPEFGPAREVRHSLGILALLCTSASTW